MKFLDTDKMVNKASNLRMGDLVIIDLATTAVGQANIGMVDGLATS